jgi:demethylmenaquinone methyltransferase/2-methoxy-6-polyprenyl-1,4-benzoquinol methylase
MAVTNITGAEVVSEDLPRQTRTTGRKEYEESYVRELFDSISHRYDFLNHFLSSGLDVYWRSAAIERLREFHPSDILDVATGTGDLAIQSARLGPHRVVGVDIAPSMLAIGREKVRKRRLDNIIELAEGSAENLGFPASSFDAVTVAFGIRNFAHLERGLREMLRVLRPGGVAVILEFSQPHWSLVRLLYGFYSRKVLPAIGGLVSRSRAAYEYLPNTIAEFPDGDDFLAILRSAGYSDTSQRRLSFGIVTLYVARKPEN